MEETLSEYEKKRLENIQRNIEYLSDLGIAPTNRNKRSSGNSSSIKQRKKQREEHNNALISQENVSTRRSSRIAALKEVDYREVCADQYLL
jgi:hypothetical protein